ncbi:hypothetical protein [Blastococcus saxobsidens]|uniref:Uncharacterized protein n=1 Tax=Blastococcus saxobsidens (strain DD2) TaxID=1146883 RepID=H6RP45_BLASD|nr:hypothetical protein [Blastococcus saxobsidens]CCG02706.1 protein of unknown function [Blastococcus saxobsidens DD2]
MAVARRQSYPWLGEFAAADYVVEIAIGIRRDGSVGVRRLSSDASARRSGGRVVGFRSTFAAGHSPNVRCVSSNSGG